MLAAENLQFSHGSTAILRGVSLTLRAGEVVAVIGPNGAGKSTLLNLLSGAAEPQVGDVTLDGRPLRQWRPLDLARRRAVLPQSPVLSFPFRVLEVVMLGRSPHAGRLTREQDLGIAAAALQAADVAHLAERIYPTLSGGERQRVQLARVLAQIWPEAPGNGRTGESCCLLLDEPTNNLDVAHQQAALAAARNMARAGHAVLAVLHDPNLASLHADTISLLVEGEIVADGQPDEVIKQSILEAAFGLRVTVLRHPENGRAVVLPA